MPNFGLNDPAMLGLNRGKLIPIPTPLPVSTGSLKLAYGDSTAMAITLSSLTYGRYSAAVDNTVTRYTDAIVWLKVKMETVTGSTNQCRVWFYGSEDGTNYSGEADGTDKDITTSGLDYSGIGLKGPFTLYGLTAGDTYSVVIGSIARFFGKLPPKWGIAFDRAASTLTITASDHAAAFRGVNKIIG
jgi:hypothetical protein